MSVGPADAQTSIHSPAVVGRTGQGSAPSIDPNLIQQTKNEIRGLVQEISKLSHSELSPDRYYEEFLSRVVQALAAEGGALWTVGDGQQLKLEYQINLPTADIIDRPETRKRHSLLLQNVLGSGLPTLVPPNSGSSDTTEAGNPTQFLLVLATIGVNTETRGIIEIFQRPGGGPTTQRGYLRFIVQMSELAGSYLKSRKLRQLGNRQSLWESLEKFLDSIHRSLSVQQTAYTLVNDSRQLIGCDRVSLAVRRGGRQRVIAVSSLDTIDRRADQVKRLSQLATMVARTRRPFWYGEEAQELPPQIDEPLQAYLDQSHATMMAIIPLARSQEDAEEGQQVSPNQEEPVGSLIVEQLEDSRFHRGFRERVHTVARHGGTALANAMEHESVFLLPIWRLLGQTAWILKARNLPKTFLAIAVLAVVLGLLTLVPADFELAADGQVQPSVRRDVFAHHDGVIVDVAAQHEQQVVKGQVLARLANNGLEVEIANLIGRQRAIRERIRSVKRSQFNGRRRREEQERLDGELLELEQVELGLERELVLLKQKQDRLVIRSPMDGQVVTWNVERLLEGRPVRLGQSLMTVVDQTGNWELELYMPERRMGHLAEAGKSSSGIPVRFVLASHPEREFRGQAAEIDRIAEVREDKGNTVRLRVVIDKNELPDLRGGTTVTAKVLCGKRALGYVIFHELMETVHKKLLLWL